MKRLFTAILLLVVLIISGCATNMPMKTVDQVDLDKFMGDWYVIASIPTMFEKNIANAIERYDRIGPRKIQTTFTYFKQNDPERHQMNPVGYVKDDPSNALWGMQFIWPIKADYRIIYLDDDYQTTIIGREKRDYVWIMARQPAIPEPLYDDLVKFIESVGYDTTELKKVPQNWD